MRSMARSARGPKRQPHAGELAHEHLGERAVELALEVMSRPARERELVGRARRVRGDAALEHGRDLVGAEQAREPADERLLRGLALADDDVPADEHLAARRSDREPVGRRAAEGSAEIDRQEPARLGATETIEQPHELAAREPATKRLRSLRHPAIFRARVPRKQFFSRWPRRAWIREPDPRIRAERRSGRRSRDDRGDAHATTAAMLT